MPELPLLLDIVSRGGTLAYTLVLFWFMYTERLVPKGRLDNCEKERDRLIAEHVAARQRAETRLKEAQENTARIVQDRDRLRERLDEQGRRRI